MTAYKVHKMAAVVGKALSKYRAEDDQYAGYLLFIASRRMLATAWHLALGLDVVQASGTERLIGFVCSREVCTGVPPKVSLINFMGRDYLREPGSERASQRASQPAGQPAS